MNVARRCAVRAMIFSPFSAVARTGSPCCLVEPIGSKATAPSPRAIVVMELLYVQSRLRTSENCPLLVVVAREGDRDEDLFTRESNVVVGGRPSKRRSPAASAKVLRQKARRRP